MVLANLSQPQNKIQSHESVKGQVGTVGKLDREQGGGSANLYSLSGNLSGSFSENWEWCYLKIELYHSWTYTRKMLHHSVRTFVQLRS